MGHMTAQERKELIEVYGLFKRSGYIKGFEPIRYSMTTELEQRVFEAMTHPIRTGNFFDIDLIDLETDMPVPPRKSILKNEPRLTQRAFPKIINQVNLYAIQDHFKELYDECI